MASLSECFRMLSMSNDITNCQIRPDFESENAILSALDKRIFIIKVDDNRLVCDWSVKTGTHLTSPVVVDSSKYVAAFSDQTIRQWGKSTKDIGKSTKINVPKKIATLLKAGESTIIVYTDATAARLDHPSGIMGEPQDSTTITCCQLALVKEEFFLAMVIEREAERFIHILQFNQDSQDIISARCTLPTGPVLCQCLRPRDTDARLFSLYSDGSLYQSILTGSPATTELLCKVPVANRQDVSMVCLDESQLAISGLTHPNQPHSGVGIWNIRFNTLQCWQPHPCPGVTTSKLFHHEGHLLLGCESSLYAYLVTLAPATVRSILAKKDTSLPQATDAQDIMELKEILERLCDPKKTPSEAAFDSCFSELTTAWPTDTSGQAECGTVSMHLKPYLTSLVARCVDTSLGFWPARHLLWLIQHKLIHASVSTLLLKSLADHKELDIMLNCLQHCNHLPESAVLTCLITFISREDADYAGLATPPTPSDQQPPTNTAEDGPFSAEKAHYVLYALAAPFNRVFMVDGLHAVDIKVVQVPSHFY